MTSQNGWSEYRHLVLAELERLDEVIKGLDAQLEATRISMTIMQTKAAMFGIIGGFVVSVLVFLGDLLLKYIHK